MRRWLIELREHPLQLRVTLLTTVGVAIAVLLSSVAGYVLLSVSLTHTSQRIAVTIAQDLIGPAGDDIRSTGRLSGRVAQVANVVVEAVSSDGTVLQVPAASQTLVLDPRDRAAAGSAGTVVRRTGRSATGEPFVIVAVPVPGTDFALVVGRSLEPVRQILAVQRLIIVGVCLTGLLAAALIGGLIGRSGLRPMHQLRLAVEYVTDTQDYHPVAVQYAKGDLAALAASFNLMLLSLTRIRARQTRLVGDAGHDLRTPLTSLRLNVELLKQDLHRNGLTLPQRGAVLDDVDAQLGELSEMIGDFVHVLREDTAVPLAALDFRDVVHTAVERVQRRAQGRTFQVAMDPLFLVGNTEELVRVATNLLDNAVKWSPPGGVVRVRLEGNRFRVSDCGPGIPEADLPFVFDRYFRGESGRTTPGTGLGLSIVAKTVEELGGTVTAGRSADGGAEFTLQLPGVTTREAVSSLLIPGRDEPAASQQGPVDATSPSPRRAPGPAATTRS